MCIHRHLAAALDGAADTGARAGRTLQSVFRGDVGKKREPEHPPVGVEKGVKALENSRDNFVCVCENLKIVDNSETSRIFKNSSRGTHRDTST